MPTVSDACDLSVVVVALVGGEALAACLRGLPEPHNRCVVVLAEHMGGAGYWETQFPAARFIDAAGLPVPLRRQRGVEAAGGDVVALLEDTSVPDPDWCRAVCQAFADPQVAAAGGPVRVSPTLPARFQALACGEYGRFHPRRFPLLGIAAAAVDGRQPVARLPGNNLAYRRERLMSLLDRSDRGLIETEVNQALRTRGFTLLLQPGMSVVYAAADRANARLRARLQHGRLFAGSRVAGQGWGTRLAWFAKSLLLPLLLSGRAWRGMTQAVRPTAWMGVAVWILLLETAWAAGEAMGYLAGSGRSLEAWR